MVSTPASFLRAGVLDALVDAGTGALGGVALSSDTPGCAPPGATGGTADGRGELAAEDGWYAPGGGAAAGWAPWGLALLGDVPTPGGGVVDRGEADGADDALGAGV